MKKLLLATLLLIAGATYAQNVGIGTKKPDESAILDLRSSSKGFLLPRLTEKQRNAIPAPAEGLMVYQTGTNQGIYIYESGKWNNLSSLTGAATRFQNATIGTLTPNYLLVGDASGNVASSTIYYDTNGNIKVNDIYLGKGNANLTNLGLGVGNILSNISTGYFNIGIGNNALESTTTGYRNTAVGAATMYNNTTGHHNTALGYRTLLNNTEGYSNVALGDEAMLYSTSASRTVAVGTFALWSNTTGINNTGLGHGALFNNISGNFNTTIGIQSLSNNSTGNRNIALGDSSGANLTTGNKNIVIGSKSLFPSATASNQLVIANSIYGKNIYDSTSAQIGIGTANPTATLDVNGTLRVRGGSPGAGKVLTSDASGNASWRAGIDSTSLYNLINQKLNRVNGTASNLTIADSILVNGKIKITGGSPGAGKVLTSDANGNARWSFVNAGNPVNIMKYVLPSNHTGRGIVNWGSTPSQTIGTAFGYMDAAGVFNVNVAGEYRVTISYSLSGDPDAFLIGPGNVRFLQFSGTQASGLPINGSVTDYLSLNAGGQIYWRFNNNVTLNAAGYNSKIIIEKIN